MGELRTFDNPLLRAAEYHLSYIIAEWAGGNVFEVLLEILDERSQMGRWGVE